MNKAATRGEHCAESDMLHAWRDELDAVAIAALVRGWRPLAAASTHLRGSRRHMALAEPGPALVGLESGSGYCAGAASGLGQYKSSITRDPLIGIGV